jgi:hypothetical protein
LSLKLNQPTTSNPSGDGDGVLVPKAGLFHALARGSLGFAAVSVAAFGVWGLGGRWINARAGEGGVYLGCALAFVIFSGLALHPLVRGPGSLARFYKIFIPAFFVYAIVWSAAWFALGFGWGEWLGSLLGSMALAMMIGRGFRTCRSVLRVALLMFAFHSAGYFLGGLCMRSLMGMAHGAGAGRNMALMAELAWGLVYGLGVGAGLGYAFFTFQNDSH